MNIADRHSYRTRRDAAASKTKFWRYTGAALLGLAVVLACSASATAQRTIWPSTIVPATVDSGSSGPVELGVLFKADTNGSITALRFYKSAANTGLHVGHLWSHTGALLATVTFSGETTSGWQQANFSTPVAITANTMYVASYQSANGHWSVNWNYFATSGVKNPPLYALQNGSGTPDGVWGTAGAFPTHTNASNYWVDVIFSSAAGVAPSITAQPASQTVTAGQTATFSVAATGTAPLTYQWKKNNAAISGANASSYTTTAMTSSDTGAQFTVTISNPVGTVTSNPATITVNVPPSITAQPASQTVTAGQTATFVVTATGTAPLSYQWQKNGAAINGANSVSYTTSATTTADNGAQFTVAIKNDAGSVISSAASLSVNALLPTAAYAFNEGSGNTTADASGNGNTGSLSGPSWTTAGHYGNALSFNGANGYVEASNSNSFNPGTAATFSAWVNVLAANADISSVINKWSQTIDDEYLFGLDSSNRLTFAWQTTGGNVWGPPSYYIVSGNTQVPLGTWTYIAVVRNGPAISFYINGNLDASFGAAADANPFRSGINTLRIGGQNRGAASRVLNGMIDEVRMYNQALTPAQIQGDMNAPIGKTALPAATYGFNEGSGNTTADDSGNANVGTLSGPSWTTAGRYGSALSFNGTNAYVEAANSNSFNPGTAATFSAWVNVLAASADVSSVVNKWSQSIDDEYLFGLNSSNRLTFAWQTTGGNVWGRPSYNIVSGNAQVPLGTWTYITVVRNGPAISFYVNGNLDATFGAAADANPFRSGIDTVRIGGQNRGAASRVLNGVIDEVRMYNQALTPTQIQGDMNALIGTPIVLPSITTQPVSQSVTAGQTATFSVAATGAAPLSYQWQKNGANIVGATTASYTTPATMTD